MNRLTHGVRTRSDHARLLGGVLCAVYLGLPRSSPAADPTNAALGPALTELTRTARHIPFKEVIQATTQHRVLDFDTNNAAHRELRQTLLKAAAQAAGRARAEGIATARANEAGNQMEAFVKAALQEVGIKAATPVKAGGGAQAAGYPDLELAGQPPCYLELKTYSAATVNTTQRSFYYSPSVTPKVTHDALHLLLAFELAKTQREGRTVFVPVQWKLLSLQDLVVDLKLEFNQGNRALYGPENAAARLGDGK